MADVAKSVADRTPPEGWSDVQTDLSAGLASYEATCVNEKTKLYSAGITDAGRAAVATLPATLTEALHLARVHLKAAGADPNAIRLP